MVAAGHGSMPVTRQKPRPQITNRIVCHATSRRELLIGMAGCCPRAAIGDAAAEFVNHFDEIAAQRQAKVKGPFPRAPLETRMPDLTPPRHIPTLPFREITPIPGKRLKAVPKRS